MQQQQQHQQQRRPRLRGGSNRPAGRRRSQSLLQTLNSRSTSGRPRGVELWAE
ncbi:unnamed protein product, partial [Ectocarpus sp. 12 AP-2014]